MKIFGLRAHGIRCFDDTGDLDFGSRFNILVGQNNAGKSALLQAILAYQGFQLGAEDIRFGSQNSWVSLALSDVKNDGRLSNRPALEGDMRISMSLQGNPIAYHDLPSQVLGTGHPVFQTQRPNHTLVPFLARRKASGFSQAVDAGSLMPITGTLQNLYSAIDALATAGHPMHEIYLKSTRDILGITITTRSSTGGKVAGFYFDSENFVTLDKMGDGVTEIIALISELCLARNRIFILEEPETNLHPRGLKALLNMVRASADYNQFFIATHSNVVVRELGGEDDSLVYRIYRDGETPQSPSRVEKVERTPAAHMRLLRELGYEFTDFDLHEGWIFLEESSAERVIRDVLIPIFVPRLQGRIRTFSAGGVNNLEPSVSEFRRLITFVHLQPVYEGRIWVRADGDEAGTNVIARMRETFPNMEEKSLSTFTKLQFESYYPEQFQSKAKAVLSLQDKKEKRKAKSLLLEEVLVWTAENKDHAKDAWTESADEIIEFLQKIENSL